jgi:hypothetical protein
MAKEGISHLGNPEYFGTMLVVFKVLGTLALIIPRAIDGFGVQTIVPLIILAILLVSYFSYHKLQGTKIL